MDDLARANRESAFSRKDLRWRDEKGERMVAIVDKTEKTFVKTDDAEPYGLLRSEGLITMTGHYNVLFLCTGNRARSILAEGILNHKGKPRFTAHSAGSHPHGVVHPLAIRELQQAGISTEGFRSKSWGEFAAPGAPRMDFVFTLCDSAAKETCRVWAGQPMTAHWGIPDPGNAGEDRVTLERAFRDAFVTLDRRIGLFLGLPFTSLDKLAIKHELDRIGHQ
jgi:arsenate reductase (thioredoxin)